MSKSALDYVSKLALDLDALLAGVEEQQELDLLADVTEVIDRVFEKAARGIVHESLGSRVAFRPGELTIWGGMGGSGKSQLVGQVIMWALAQGECATIASLEMPMGETLRRMLRQAIDGEPTIEAAHAFADAMQGRFYLYDQIDRVPAARILAMTRVAATKLGSTHVVIDSLTKCGLPQDGDGYLSRQTEFVDALQRIVKHLGVHCHLVVHLRKGEKGRRGMHDIRGASQISDLADNVFLLDRNVEKERILAEAEAMNHVDWSDEFERRLQKAKKQPDAVLQVEKQRATGWLGDIGLDFHARSGQFIPTGSMRAMPWTLE